MTRVLAGFAAALILTGSAGGQSTEASQKFTDANVRVSTKSANAYQTRIFRAGRFEFRKATMLDLVSFAYGVERYRVLGGPGWLETDRFDIVASTPAGTTEAMLGPMVKNLLIERFKLAIRNDTKSIPTFFLTGKEKRNMKPGDESGGAPGCRSMPPPPAAPDVVPFDTLSCKNVTMRGFIDALRYPAAPYLGVGPVLDKTGIEGGWDFNIKWTRRALLPQAGRDGTTIFDAVDKQLGLKLELQNAPTPVIIVDHVDQKPTANPAGVTERIPPAPEMPKEFEVADVKPSRPGATGVFRIEPNGRVEIRATTLQNFIALAWDTDPEMLVDGPKWLNADRFDIIANAPTDGGAKTVQVDFETIQTMMRALLAERFGLAVHTATRPVSVYALTAPKRETKMKKADESNRASCKYSPELLPPKTALTNIYSCQNTTIGYLAEQLRGWAPQYFDHQVVDLTGVEGSFDFTLGWTGKGRMPAAVSPGQPGGLAPASDPNGGITVFEAVAQQLGLKLKEQKHPMPVLVIDHVEQKPTDN